jgi:MarR family 2-MHQ and catechol resistance regulon transcriptional repressor
MKSIPGSGSNPTPSATARYGPDAELALKLWVVLTRAQGAVGSHASDDIKQHGLTEGEFGVLELLHHKGPLLLGEIQRRVFVSSGGITFLVDKLEAKGLVERRDCPSDRRARYAALTPKGDSLLARIFPVHAQRIVQAMRGLNPGEQRAAIDLLRRLGHSAAGHEAGEP